MRSGSVDTEDAGLWTVSYQRRWFGSGYDPDNPNHRLFGGERRGLWERFGLAELVPFTGNGDQQ